MIYSDFAAPTLSTSADTAATTATITYNGFATKLLGAWGISSAGVATAAQGIKPYAILTGYKMPGSPPTFPIGRWRSAYLVGASVGSVSNDPSFQALDLPAGPSQTVTVDIRNAASSTAPKSLLGLIYSDGETLPLDWALNANPWNLRAVPKTVIAVGPTSITGTTETAVGATDVAVNNEFPTLCGISTFAVTNGVRVTAESFRGTVRYTSTGIKNFEPAQKWPFFGQQDAPAGTDIQDESFMPGMLQHPITASMATSSTIGARVTLQSTISNASAFHTFAWFR